jgi:hypothetical protein
MPKQSAPFAGLLAEPVTVRRCAPTRRLAMMANQDDAAIFCGKSAAVIVNPS